MVRDDTALVMVLPEDGADVVLRKLRSASARSVQLLVADGAVALRRREVAERINDLAIAEGIELTLISSDDPTVAAATAAGILTLKVDDSRVLAPRRSSRPDRPATAYSTRVIERSQSPGSSGEYGVPPRPTDPQRAASRLPDELAALPPAEAAPSVFPDEFDVAPAVPPPGAVRQAARGPVAPAVSDADLLAASFLDDVPTVPSRPAPTAAAPVAKPQPTVAAKALPAPRQSAPAPLRSAQAAVAIPAPAARRTRTVGRGWPIFALTAALLLLLLTIGGLLLWSSRATVTVAAPVRPDSIEPFADLPVPIAPAGSDAAAAVIAEPIVAEASATQAGEVTQGTLTPSGTASGVVNLLNSSTQSIVLPAGTEFVAVKGDGQEVPFVSNADALVPGATTADRGAEIVTTRGQAQVAVSAKSPGSGSNVEANTIRRITPPGGPTFNANGGSLIVTNPPIEGGTEQEVRIIKDSDVDPLFTPVLESLDAQARGQLESLARERGLTVDSTTITPRRSELEQLQGFERSVEPPVGTTLDTANPRFNLVVRATYNALAAPPDRPVSAQLGAAVTEQLRQSGALQPGDCRAPAVVGWRWDGQRLLVNGEIQPDRQSPRCQGGLDAAALAQVREAVRGKSRDEAVVALDALVAQGVIGSYNLPNNATLPRFDWLLTVRGQ